MDGRGTSLRLSSCTWGAASAVTRASINTSAAEPDIAETSTTDITDPVVRRGETFMLMLGLPLRCGSIGVKIDYQP